MHRYFAVLVMFLAACDVPVATQTPGRETTATPSQTQAQTMSPQEAARSFAQVVAAVEPVAEYECRRRTRNVNCDFLIAVDRRRNAAPNAFQSEDKDGRPVITFTIGLIASARNANELAFVMGHEAAHHIQGHLARQKRNAQAGAAVFAGLATLTGGNAGDVQNALELGAQVGARTYSKEFELEADELGTIITHRAGFDPLIGAEFFARIPDPGDQFLGSHPPNAARVEIVRKTAARVAASG